MFRKSNLALDSVDEAVKSSLIERLKDCVKELQLKYTAEQWTPLKNEEATNALCWILEAVFIHGLKNTFIKSLSMFSSRKENTIPNPSFWDFVMIFSHRDIIEQVRKLNYVNTDIGRCRAWIRITLNEMSLVSYLENMFKNLSYVRSFYKPCAFLRDSERCDILKNYLVGVVESCKFDLVVDNSLLNQWNSGPLALVGLWVDDNISQGIDVAQNMDSKDLQAIPQLGKSKTPEPDFISALRRQPLLPEEDAFRIIMASKPANSSCAGSAASSRRNSDASQPSKDHHIIIPSGSSHMKPLRVPNPKNASLKESKEPLPKRSSPPTKSNVSIIPQASSSVGNPFELETPGFTEKSIYDLNINADEISNEMTQNKEESEVESKSDVEDEPLSYAELLNTYSRHQQIGASIYCGQYAEKKEELDHATLTENAELEETISSSEFQLPTVEEIDDGFELVTKFINKKELADMIPIFTKYSKKIANQVGMDTQNYSCKSCRAHIGMIFVPVRVCHFTGYNFCTPCHANDENVIPSRILLNWDFERYGVCKQAHEFLEGIKDQPLFNLEDINPKLYSHIDELAELRTIRTKLNYISVYLKTCKDSNVLKEFSKDVWSREHLYESIHIYSISDLQNVPNRTLATHLSKLFNLGKSHITHCKICKAKGFVCEICRNPQVIFPFNLESIFKCHLCGAVYHNTCMNHAKPCPRCERWKVVYTSDDECFDP